MGLMDEVKKAVGDPKDLMNKAKQQINAHEQQIDSMVEKAGHFVDEKTGGKYADKIDKVQSTIEGKTGNL